LGERGKKKKEGEERGRKEGGRGGEILNSFISIRSLTAQERNWSWKKRERRGEGRKEGRGVYSTSIFFYSNEG